MRHLDPAEAHAMRSKLDALEEADKAKAHAICREAKEAAHHVYASGMATARFSASRACTSESTSVHRKDRGGQ